MSLEQSGDTEPLRHIHVDLAEHTITLQAASGQATRFSFRLDGIFYQLLQLPADRLVAGDEADEAAPEREPTVILSGKLKSAPREGRPDSSGLPTAWARFAAHDPASRHARLYLATFHRHTADIALGLPAEVSLTVEGYPHQSRQAGRLDTLSVVHLIRYPGQEERTE